MIGKRDIGNYTAIRMLRRTKNPSTSEIQNWFSVQGGLLRSYMCLVSSFVNIT